MVQQLFPLLSIMQAPAPEFQMVRPANPTESTILGFLRATALLCSKLVADTADASGFTPGTPGTVLCNMLKSKTRHYVCLQEGLVFVPVVPVVLILFYWKHKTQSSNRAHVVVFLSSNVHRPLVFILTVFLAGS